jgi:hypothetical protein
MKCQALSNKGKPCGCFALKGEDYCIFHSKSERAQALRKKGGFVSRKELLRVLTRDFRELASRTDEASRSDRLRLAYLLHELVNEQQQWNRIKRLAREKGLI